MIMSIPADCVPQFPKHEINHQARFHRDPKDALWLRPWDAVPLGRPTNQSLECLIILVAEHEGSSIAVSCGF